MTSREKEAIINIIEGQLKELRSGGYGTNAVLAVERVRNAVNWYLSQNECESLDIKGTLGIDRLSDL